MKKVTDGKAGSRLQQWVPWLGALIGAAVLAWVLQRFDLDRFLVILSRADPYFFPLLPLAIAAEQLVRAWKWRQLLHPMRSVGTLPLFGAIMAAYLTALLVPVALLLVVFPDPTGDIRGALAWGSAGSLVLFALLFLTLGAYKREALRPGS